MKICLVPGHGPTKDRGAQNEDTGTTELDWNRDLVRRIAGHLKNRADVFIVNRTKEGLSPVQEINLTGADVALEFHLNAATGKASGTEMIYISNAGRVLAERMLNAAVRVLGLPNRGVKKPFAGRGNFFLTKTRMPAVIVESAFIDNNHDLNVLNANKDKLALAYADALAPIAPTDA